MPPTHVPKMSTCWSPECVNMLNYMGEFRLLINWPSDTETSLDYPGGPMWSPGSFKWGRGGRRARITGTIWERHDQSLLALKTEKRQESRMQAASRSWKQLGSVFSRRDCRRRKSYQAPRLEPSETQFRHRAPRACSEGTSSPVHFSPLLFLLQTERECLYLNKTAQIFAELLWSIRPRVGTSAASSPGWYRAVHRGAQFSKASVWKRRTGGRGHEPRTGWGGQGAGQEAP